MTLLIYSTHVLLLLILTALYHHLLNASANCHDVTLYICSLYSCKLSYTNIVHLLQHIYKTAQKALFKK